MTSYMPLTGSDLREIADMLDKVDMADSDSPFGSALVGRVEIYRPDSDTAEVIGHFIPFDDWYGFTMDGAA